MRSWMEVSTHTQKKQSQVGIIWGRVENKLPTSKRCDSPYLCQFLEMLGPARHNSFMGKQEEQVPQLVVQQTSKTNKSLDYISTNIW